jgi:glycosyltransferase involved in cell wall biosynthesis
VRAVSAQPRIVSRRRRLLGATAIAAHRAALALVRRLPERRRAGPPAPRPHVRILISNAYAMGGTVRAAFVLAEQLVRDRPVEIVSVRRHVRKPHFAPPAGVSVAVLDDRVQPRRLGQRLLGALPSVLVHPEDYAYPGSSLFTDLKLLRRLRATGAEVVITTRPAWALLAAAAAPRTAVLIAEEHMHLRAHRPALRRDVTRRYGRLDALMTLTEGDRRDYASLLASARTRVEAIPNAVPTPAGGGADPEAQVVVAAGRLTRQKGLDLLIRAFAGIADVHPGWELRIYGGGRERRALAKQIADAGMAERIRLMGSTRRLGKAFARASVFALSSRFEGFGIVIVEAMACGLAIVSFDCPRGPGEIIDHGRDGVLVPAEDVDALAQELSALMRDAARRRALGRAARETARRYEPALVAERWEALLRDLTAPGGGSRAVPSREAPARAWRPPRMNAATWARRRRRD